MSTNTKLAEALRCYVLGDEINERTENQLYNKARRALAALAAEQAAKAVPDEDYGETAYSAKDRASKAVPAGFVLVPVEVLEDAATAIGHFVSDHGWSAEDMQAMDNLDAYIARHKANAAPATPSPAPDCED